MTDGNNVLTVTKRDSGTWVLSADNSYSGATSIDAGTLVIDGSGDINQSSAVTIGSGATLRYNSSVGFNTNITNNGGTIGGTGPFLASVTLDSISDTLAPGNSPGIQAYATGQTWSSFTYEWEVNDFDGTNNDFNGIAGADFDQIQVDGALNLTGGVGDYVLDLISLAGSSNTPGNVADFSESTTSWNILTATDGITGFNPTNWTIDATTGPNVFTSSPAWTGTWSLSMIDTPTIDTLVLTYTQSSANIPEPSTILLAGLGLAGLVLRRRRR